MKHTFTTLLAILFLMQFATAQILPSTAKSIPVMYKINLQEASANNVWNTNLRTMPHKPKTILGNSENVKLRNKIEKLNNAMVQTSAAYKTTGATPTIGSSFKGNDLSTNTPSDNSIAIGNDGKIVVVNNFSIAVYDSAGNTLITPNTWTGILNPFSPALLRGKFDPRVLYDPYHDRYIFCILHAPVDPANSSFILGFSQSNDPTQGWNIYNLSGNPLSNGAWTDYPNMGINEYELFINANLFGTAATNYKFFGTFIEQIDLSTAYAGGSLQHKTWTGFDSTKYITLVPAPNGLLNTAGERHMNFAMLNPGEDTLVHVFTINDTMNAPGVNVTHTEFTIPYYSACADGYINGGQDSISTGSAWIQNAFTLDSTIHFTFSANAAGYCGINYGRIYLDQQSAEYETYSEPGNDLAYPAIASLGFDNQDRNAAIVYLRASNSILPEICAITIDDNKSWTTAQTIKKGDTIVDILSSGAERWGDYTGIARRYKNLSRPEVWLYGCYSAFTNAVWTYGSRKGYSNWIAQIQSNDNPLANVEPIKKQQNITVFPNPTRDQYFLHFDLKEPSDVQIALFDIQGKKIKQLFNGNLPASQNEFSFDRNALTNGQYFIQINVNDAVQTKKLIVVE